MATFSPASGIWRILEYPLDKFQARQLANVDLPYWIREAMFAYVIAALLFFSSPQSAVSQTAPVCSNACKCSIYVDKTIQQPYRYEIINYGVLAEYCSGQEEQVLVPLCNSACASRCSGDMRNATLLCNKYGGTFDSLARTFQCYWEVQRYANSKVPNPSGALSRTTVNGCKKTCTCPVPALYDVIRGSCVKPAGCAAVPGMPNGDKGGGYFATAGKLYRNVPGAVCRASLIWRIPLRPWLSAQWLGLMVSSWPFVYILVFSAVSTTAVDCWRDAIQADVQSLLVVNDFLPRNVGPLILEMLWAKRRVSTGALWAQDDSLMVQTEFWKSSAFHVENT